ncbi:uncharacterized protein VTP21DRAFT_5128 [Calcarisporiella thermophila]|uniref:uncharacterized protein n=1 Tax=Calcarisporiella thermophila TaxID=911321 RepID=UPI0037439F78
MFRSLLLLLSFFSLILAKEIEVQVGPRPFTYDPATLNVDVGDKLVFRFINGNHSVTQSAELNSCAPVPNGFDSDVNGPGRSFNITFKKPGKFWFYCKVGQHCQNGMKGTVIVGNALAGPDNSTLPSGVSSGSLPPTGTLPVSAGSALPSDIPRGVTPSVVPSASAGANAASSSASHHLQSLGLLLMIPIAGIYALSF